MNKKSRSKSSLFLMELIIVIMFFSLCAAICMRVFANAKVKTDSAREITNASLVAQTAAEYYKEFDGDLNLLGEKFGLEFKDSVNSFEVNYDEEWNTCRSDGEYIMTVTKQDEEHIDRALISIKSDDGEDLFSLVTAVTSVKGEGGAANG